MLFDLINTDGHARRGRLTFERGVVQTPIFMPVGTYGSVKSLTLHVNTEMLWRETLQPGIDFMICKYDIPVVELLGEAKYQGLTFRCRAFFMHDGFNMNQFHDSFKRCISF